MNIKKAHTGDLNTIYNIVSESIKGTYPKYYADEIVDFFLMIHSKENIERDLSKYETYLLEYKGNYVGTGCIKGDNLARLYFLPDFQGKGGGSFMMDFLEGEAFQKYHKIYLSSSLPAMHFYEKRGYKIINHEECKLKNDIMLVHDTMEKTLTKA